VKYEAPAIIERVELAGLLFLKRLGGIYHHGGGMDGSPESNGHPEHDW